MFLAVCRQLSGGCRDSDPITPALAENAVNPSKRAAGGPPPERDHQRGDAATTPMSIATSWLTTGIINAPQICAILSTINDN
jgi:hypothetical protein